MKLLHERLRKWAQNDKDGVPVLHEWTHYFGGSLDSPPKDADIWELLADEIERYYIPRPRFEDGEPMQWGELFRGYNGEECDLAAFTVSSDGHYLLNEHSGDCDFHIKSYNDFVKRPTPKVYDADDVEIKVGDTVWSLANAKELKVNELASNQIICAHVDGWGSYEGFDADKLTHERPVFDAEGVRICKGDTVWPIDPPYMKMTVDNFQQIYGQDVTVNCEFEGSFYNFNPDKLTHREPDSIQKIRDYLIDCGNSDPSGMYYEAADRLTSIMKRGAK